MPLGFTFSYPATQESIDHAVLQTWTKGFDIKGIEGNNVAEQLRDEIKAKKLPFELICIINNTVGAMIASAYNDSKTIVGAIFGTGCNAAYMASLSDTKKLPQDDKRLSASKKGSEQKMAINCEYGALDNARRVLPLTTYDKANRRRKSTTRRTDFRETLRRPLPRRDLPPHPRRPSRSPPHFQRSRHV